VSSNALRSAPNEPKGTVADPSSMFRRVCFQAARHTGGKVVSSGSLAARRPKSDQGVIAYEGRCG